MQVSDCSPLIISRKAKGWPAWLPSVAAIATLLSCNGVAVLVAVLSLIEITIVIDPNLQAAVISLLAVLTVALVYLKHQVRRNVASLLLGGVGAMLIVGTMYISYSKPMETLGLFSLISASVWNWRCPSQE
jgi:hypothetical protein